MKLSLGLFLSFMCFACAEKRDATATIENQPIISKLTSDVSLVVLGTIQDAGSPHIGCKKECCAALFNEPDVLRRVVSLGLIDSEENKNYLFEATPDISTQLKMLKDVSGSTSEMPHGIFLTHAHIGHYTGLMYLGKEATNTKDVPVYAMPRMKSFLENNGPWSQLVNQRNILLSPIHHSEEIKLSKNLTIVPLQVPHRDEFSETVGYKIIGPNKSALFIPDIDKWEKWELDIMKVISEVDYAFLDATFFDGAEINTRDISEIPHPFIVESLVKFDLMSSEEKKKIHFIHFNHTNPVIRKTSEAYKLVIDKGFNIAQINMLFNL